MPIALGPLALSHQRFYRLTPREFHELHEGYTWRERRREEQEASWVAILVQPHVKERVTAAKLLGRPIGPPRKTSKDTSDGSKRLDR